MDRVAGLIFDFDGTLVDSQAAYAEALQAVGIDPNGPAFKKARSRVKARLGPGHVAARNRLLYFKEMLEGQGGSPAKVLCLMAKYEAQLESIIRRQWQTLRRAELLQPLLRGRPALILTNENTRTQLIKWRAVDPDAELFQSMITSEELGVEKPHPRMFEQALGRFGLPPEAWVMIGDDVEADVAPALRLGMRAVLSREFSTTDAAAQGATFAVIDKLAELGRLLA